MSSSSISQSTSPTGAAPLRGVGLSAAVVMTVVACCLHVLASRSGVPVNSAWFIFAGLSFLAVTAASHLVLSRREKTGTESAGEIGSLLISMTIRLSGTFLILGLLLLISPLERPEAVFSVLFWYITLTATDLFGLVRDRLRTQQESAAGRSIAIGENQLKT